MDQSQKGCYKDTSTKIQRGDLASASIRGLSRRVLVAIEEEEGDNVVIVAK